MKEPYDPTKAPLGPMGSRSNRRALIIQHNKKVLARRLRKLKETLKTDD
jgi:hypothetical protein